MTTGHPGEKFRKAGGEACLEPGKKGGARETDFGIISNQSVVTIIRVEHSLRKRVWREKEKMEGGVHPWECEPYRGQERRKFLQRDQQDISGDMQREAENQEGSFKGPNAEQKSRKQELKSSLGFDNQAATGE